MSSTKIKHNSRPKPKHRAKTGCKCCNCGGENPILTLHRTIRKVYSICMKCVETFLLSETEKALQILKDDNTEEKNIYIECPGCSYRLSLFRLYLILTSERTRYIPSCIGKCHKVENMDTFRYMNVGPKICKKIHCMETINYYCLRTRTLRASIVLPPLHAELKIPAQIMDNLSLIDKVRNSYMYSICKKSNCAGLCIKSNYVKTCQKCRRTECENCGVIDTKCGCHHRIRVVWYDDY